MTDALRVLDLFSGIGGFSLGFERAGMRTVAFCETDAFCRAVLAKHWPDVPCHEDVRTLKGSDVGSVDVVCGGYPCQPFSVAGKRQGSADDRHLWPEMRRLVAELRPAWVVGENVAGHITMGLDDVLSDLEGLHYACRTFVVPACAVGAHHRRDRIWIVGHADSDGWQEGQQAATPVGYGSPALSASRYVADANGSGLSIRSIHPGMACRQDGKPKGEAASIHGWWDSEPDVGRVADGVPARVDRLRALGNSVVPQVAEEIGRAIVRAHEGLSP